MARASRYLAAGMAIPSLSTQASTRAATATRPTSGLAAATAPPAYKMQPGPHAVEIARSDWLDEKRHRPVPAKVYYPRDMKDPCAVIIFSHGLGGTREGYEYHG